MSNSETTTAKATPDVDWDSRSISSLTTVVASNKVTPASMGDIVPHDANERDVDSLSISTLPSSTTPRRTDDWISTAAGLPVGTIQDPGVETGDFSISFEEFEWDSELEQEQAALREQEEAAREQEEAAREKRIALREKRIALRKLQRLRNEKNKRKASQQDHPDEHKKKENGDNDDDDDNGQQRDSKPAAKRHKEM
jgi:hypothetical protein